MKEETSSVLIERYPSCRNGTEVVLYTIKNGEHAWPGGKVHLPGRKDVSGISATDIIWDFFKNHPKRS